METKKQPLDMVEHLVVLMLENRSFDCLMGYLYDDGSYPQHFIPESNKKPFNGVTGKTLFNFPHPKEKEGPDNPRIPVEKAPYKTQLDMTNPSPDPGETYLHVNCQLYGEEKPNSFPDQAPMNGFVKDYINAMQTTEGWDNTKHPTFDEYKIIMNCFTREAVPVLSGLARDFAVSDEWFCSVPSQTFCNRSFFHAATSHGFVTNSDYVKWLKNDHPTILNLLSDNGHDWRVYWDKQDVFSSLTRLIHPRLYHKKFDANFRKYGHRYGENPPLEEDRFRKDCQAGDLPAYTFIEPRLFINHNDMHPPTYVNPGIDSSILAGEILVNKIYEDLFIYGKNKDKTLLIITFDEHGGCYDHVPPLPCTPPEPNPCYPLQDGFGFNRLGLRVPAIFVSPWIKAGTVFRSGEGKPLSHTSVIRTIINRWSLKPDSLTNRDKDVPDISKVLNADQMLTEWPRYKPRHYEPIPEPDLNKSIPSDLQRAMFELLMALLRRTPPKNLGLMEMLRFAEKVINEIEGKQGGCLFKFFR